MWEGQLLPGDAPAFEVMRAGDVSFVPFGSLPDIDQRDLIQSFAQLFCINAWDRFDRIFPRPGLDPALEPADQLILATAEEWPGLRDDLVH